jgi:ketosteroid isomerase-like protein
MADPRIELVSELFDRVNGERDSIYELLSEDFVAEVPPSVSAEPDTYEGHAGVRRYMDAFAGLLEDVRFEPLEFHLEDGRVIVDLMLKGRGAASGIEVEQRSAVMHSVSGGKVTRMEVFPNVEAARSSLRKVG